MAQVIHELWMANDPSVVIMPSNVIVSSPRVEPELLHYLDISWQAIIAGDVDGENSTPYKIDQAAPNLNRYSATRRVARTLFMGSAPTYQQQNSGLDDKRINLGARTMNRLRGDVSVPALNAKTTAYWVAENNAPTEGAPTFRQVTMAPKTIAAYVDLSRKLLIQSDPSVEQVIRNDLVSQIGTAIDAVAIEGGGSNEPTGILQTTGIGDYSLGTNGGAPTWDMVVGLIEDVQSAHADTGRLGYLTNAKVASKLARTLKVASTDSVHIHEGGNSMLGFPFRVTNNVPGDLTTGTGSALSAMIFGAWENLMIRAFNLAYPFDAHTY